MQRFIWFISTITGLLGLVLASMFARVCNAWPPRSDAASGPLDWWEA